VSVMSVDAIPQPRSRRSAGKPSFRLKQEHVVSAAAVALFALFALKLPGFLSAENIELLFKNVAVLALLSMATAVVVIGRGLDLSQIAILAVTTAWTVALMDTGLTFSEALLCGLSCAVVAGMINGFLVAYIEIPAVFATLAFGIFFVGVGRLFLFSRSLFVVSAQHGPILFLGQGKLFGVPVPVLIVAAFWITFAILMRRTVFGKSIYAIGDNSEAARITGIKVRPLIVAQYALAAAITYMAGLVQAGTVSSVNVGLASGTLIFDVLMVVVVGGISLVGGRGGPLSILAGVALIGTLLNGLIILNISSDVQNIIKGAVLLAAIVVDMKLNPRDEETARQGEL
jgi:ribose transport system permease protein